MVFLNLLFVKSNYNFHGIYSFCCLRYFFCLIGVDVCGLVEINQRSYFKSYSDNILEFEGDVHIIVFDFFFLFNYCCLT